MTSLIMFFLISMTIYNLCAATSVSLSARNISDDHPAVQILHDLETTTYYVDENWSGNNMARCIIQAILKWTNMLYCCLKVTVPYVYCGFTF